MMVDRQARGALKADMKNGIRIAFMIALVLSALAMPTFSAASLLSFKGHWRVDMKRSFVPNGPMPRSVTLDVITDDGRLFESQEIQVTADGKKLADLVHARLDGKFYPVSGSPGNFSVAITQRRTDFLRMEFAAPDDLHGMETCKISRDLNTLICDILITDARGRNSLGRSVYVRSQ